jgi:triphosphoribosyl-dephospho-CoA synthase
VTSTVRPDEISVLVQAACLIEVSAKKPGNVSPARDFEDMRFEHFLLSAAAIGPAFGQAARAGVGATVLAAVRDTRRFVPVNTNLGLVLLLAPLACAAGREGGTLRERLSGVLRELTVDDARAAYQAIVLADPGGLGRVEAQDVREEPTLTLRQTMALAAERDTIAREYVTDYEVTFDQSLPAVRRAREGGLGWAAAALEAYLQLLAEVPDSLIARKEGREAAQLVSDRARAVLASGTAGSAPRTRAEERLDAELGGKDHRLNPGTTADLVAAALFVALVEDL